MKNFHWGDLTRALYEAYDRGGHYPVLLDADGNVTEGAGYNVFALVGGRLLTPAHGTLRGITQRTVLELAAAEGVPTETTVIPEATFRAGEELFATTTAGGVMPITSLDGEPVGDGRPGPLTRRLRDLYWAAHEDPRYARPVDYGGLTRPRPPPSGRATSRSARRSCAGCATSSSTGSSPRASGSARSGSPSATA